MDSGARESNEWITYPQDRDSCGKLQVIPDNISGSNGELPPGDGASSY